MPRPEKLRATRVRSNGRITPFLPRFSCSPVYCSTLSRAARGAASDGEQQEDNPPALPQAFTASKSPGTKPKNGDWLRSMVYPRKVERSEIRLPADACPHFSVCFALLSGSASLHTTWRVNSARDCVLCPSSRPCHGVQNPWFECSSLCALSVFLSEPCVRFVCSSHNLKPQVSGLPALGVAGLRPHASGLTPGVSVPSAPSAPRRCLPSRRRSAPCGRRRPRFRRRTRR